MERSNACFKWRMRNSLKVFMVAVPNRCSFLETWLDGDHGKKGAKAQGDLQSQIQISNVRGRRSAPCPPRFNLHKSGLTFSFSHPLLVAYEEGPEIDD